MVDVTLIYLDTQFLDCQISDKLSSESMFVTFVYGLNNIGDRKLLWPGIYNISQSVTGPWLLEGDFNAIYSPEYRIGGDPVTSYEIKDFLNAIDDLQIFPLNSVGGTFAWSNKDGVLSKIDHVFSNSDWFAKFSHCIATFLPRGISDHSSIIISTIDCIAGHKAPFKVLGYYTW